MHVSINRCAGQLDGEWGVGRPVLSEGCPAYMAVSRECMHSQQKGEGIKVLLHICSLQEKTRVLTVNRLECLSQLFENNNDFTRTLTGSFHKWQVVGMTI